MATTALLSGLIFRTCRQLDMWSFPGGYLVGGSSQDGRKVVRIPPPLVSHEEAMNGRGTWPDP